MSSGDHDMATEPSSAEGESHPADVHVFDESNLVPPARRTRRAAVVVAVGLIVLALLLLVSPWRQNIAATGRVIALDPLDRLQTIPAPVTGKLSIVHVQEGAVVKKGDPLVELSDLDPDYVTRLGQQVEFVRRKVDAERETVAFYDRQLELLDEERAQAIAVAQADLAVAGSKVNAEEQDLLAGMAELKQKELDRKRREQLFAKTLVSELDLQKAVAAAVSAKAKVNAIEAKLAQAESEKAAKEAKVEQVRKSTQAKIESVRGTREGARSKFASAEKELTEAQTKLLRQNTQIVKAPSDGIVLRVHAAARSNLVKSGEPLVDFVPSARELAVELWIRGNDAPLISINREVRLQFEGWPAVQFPGWPSVAVGTFGGRVRVVDAHDDGTGRFRLLVVQDPDEPKWPDLFFARQGTRANGWVLLDEVSLGYEFWRQLNAFPPVLRNGPGKYEKQSFPGKAKEASSNDKK